MILNYKNTESLLKEENGLIKILELANVAFNNMEVYVMKFKKGEVNASPNECASILSKVTGYYCYFNSITTAIDTFKTHKELELFVQKKKAYDSDKKIVASILEKEVSHEVQYIRQVRNQFENYRDMANKMIGTCQSILKNFEREKNIKYD